MATRDLPPNSDSSKVRNSEIEKRARERQDISSRKVAQNETTHRKEDNMLTSFLSTIIVNDVRDVKEHVMKEVVEPRIRSGILDVIIEGSRFLLGDDTSRSYGRSSIDNRGSRYHAATNSGSSNISRDDRNRNRSHSSSFDSRDYPLPSRGKAEEVLSKLRQDIEEYDRATVAAFLKEVGVNPSYTDMDIGWYELDPSYSFVRGTIDGWVVVLPKPGKV